MKTELHDAVKKPCSNGGALLQWGFNHLVPPEHSLQMPESVVDLILRMRDKYEREPKDRKMRECLARIIRDAERAKNSHWITRADAIEHIMRLARYAEDALAS